MASTSFCFDKKMKEVLRKFRVQLVSDLQVDDLLDHLIQKHVFECDDYIKAEKTRQEKVRKLLDDLQKRPASDFWKFIQAMHDTKQSHLADKLIQEYIDLGGVVPFVTGSQHEHSQPTEQGRRDESPYHEWSDGRVVASPCDTTISDSQDNRQSRQRQQNTNCTVYKQKKAEYPSKIYKMESRPRGLALVIDNESFYPGVGDRHGTADDAKALRNLLTNLDFDVQMKRDCSAEEMRSALQNFALSLSEREIDACIVAVLSHGKRYEEILGTDGQVVTTSEMRRYFGSQLCPTMAGKPKLFILQACKGEMEDTFHGQRHVQRDSLTDVEEELLPQQAVPRQLSDNADVCFLYATVEGFVAYRNVFIHKLCQVFRENADKFHVKEIATLLNSEMASLRLEGGRLTMSEDRGSLTKFWYLNPPSSV